MGGIQATAKVNALKFTCSKGLTQRHVRIPHFGDRTTIGRLVPFKPATQKGGDGWGHQDCKRHCPGQSGLAALPLPDANFHAQIPAVHAGKRPAIWLVRGIPPPPIPSTRWTGSGSGCGAWHWRRLLIPQEWSLDKRAAVWAPKPPSPQVNSIAVPGQPLPGPQGATPAFQLWLGTCTLHFLGSGPRRVTWRLCLQVGLQGPLDLGTLASQGGVLLCCLLCSSCGLEPPCAWCQWLALPSHMTRGVGQGLRPLGAELPWMQGWGLGALCNPMGPLTHHH